MSEKVNYNKNNRLKIILILLGGGFGILLLLFGGFGNKSANEESNPSDVALLDGAEEYADFLEENICSICSGVRGVGTVEVFVSLKGGYRTVYAVDSQSTSSGYKSQIVMSGSGSDKQAVITAYQNPEIAGVGIVCSGADDPEVRRQIISLVSAALDISTNKIFVAAA